MQKKKLILKIFILSLIPIFLLIMDFFNIPSLFFNMSRINWGFVMGIINSAVVVILYIITYNVLNKRTVEKEENKSKICLLLIKQSLELVESHANSLDEKSVKEYLVPKVDFNTVNDGMIAFVSDAPFKNDELILDLARDGQISKNIFLEYFNVKDSYKKFVNGIVIFNDKKGANAELKRKLLKDIAKAKDVLNDIELLNE